MYGAILNPGCRFFDKRIGQSTTLTGRQIVKHMSAEVNKTITGEYDHTGDAVIYGDTDSLTGDAVIETSKGPMAIEELYIQCDQKKNTGDKHYGFDSDIMVMSYDKTRDEPYFGHINYVYKHSVSKQLYEVEDELGNVVTVTEDHSIMVERQGDLIEVKPQEIQDNDILVSIEIKEIE